jgi:hypothetical protein
VHDGPELVFPGDRGLARTVSAVRDIDVAVTQATVPTPPAGSVVVAAGGHRRVLSADTLAALPSTTLSVSFLAGTASQTHTETGPTLATVLRAAHLRTGPSTVVGALGDDGYLADVTPAEATSGGRPLLLSTAEDGAALAQPRLIADGDVKGGRDVSGVVELIVLNAGGRCGRGHG